MRVVIQRVSNASVTIDGKVKSAIKKGLLILIGIEDADNDADIAWLVRKIVQIRIFNDDKGIMNRSVTDVDGEVLVISQFTLFASTKKGNRPSYIRASKADFAIPVYEKFLHELSVRLKKPVESGIFGADMKVKLLNDGPTTIIMDSKEKDF
ncbi:MAG: D-tyrosyl-tRNA(Tyr) deacylase [Prolixibacteraceae bacterium]|nr:D-tyrosyl-tRNA(Tyr) deacylase [Prolixibacteraceae bacterium]